MAESKGTKKDIFLYAIASPYTFEVIEICKRGSISIKGFIHNFLESEPSRLLTPLYNHNFLTQEQIESFLVIPLITPGHRKVVVEETKQLGFSNYYSLIDPTSVIASSSSWEEGFLVNAGTVIGANSTFKKHVSINRSVSIGHDVQVNNFVSFGPACVICGSCTIDEGVFIGANATILPKVNIGKNAVIGAGAVVSKDVLPNTLVVGNPAKVSRNNIKGYNDVSV